MILISKDEEWPKYLDVDKITGIPTEKDISVKAVIMNGASDWMRKNGYHPTHILMPIRFRRVFESQLTNFFEFQSATSGNENSLMGFKLIWVSSPELELVGDPDGR